METPHLVYVKAVYRYQRFASITAPRLHSINGIRLLVLIPWFKVDKLDVQYDWTSLMNAYAWWDIPCMCHSHNKSEPTTAMYLPRSTSE